MGEIKKEEDLKKVQELDEDLKGNCNADVSTKEKSCCEFYSQLLKPKLKHCYSVKDTNATCSGIVFQSSTESQNEGTSIVQNCASCSLSNSVLSSPSSSMSKTLSDVQEKNSLSYSVEKCLAKGRTLSSEDNELNYHDKKRKTGSFVDNESSSGNEGDETLSGDDCCIYTYKGDQFADLPNSFFTANMASQEGNQLSRDNFRRPLRPQEQNRSNPGSSPEMDYLEMDFDPGPSLEQDSEEEMDEFDRKHNINNPSSQSANNQMIVNFKEENQLQNLPVNIESSQSCKEPQPGPTSFKCSPKSHSPVSDSNSFSSAKTKNGVEISENSRDETVKNNNSSNQRINFEEYASGENISFITHKLKEERLDKILLSEKPDLSFFKSNENKVDLKTPFDGIMLWTEQEAISKQSTLVSPDVSCGATAVINAMLVLKMRFSFEKVTERISTRLKSESASIPQYLVSRSFAGVAHENLIRGIHHASHGALYARFFQMYPRRDIVLSRWLSYWMKKGAVPIATMNVQRDTNLDELSLDTRHHQMIFGVNSKGIYLTDPLECLQDEELWSRLVSPSVLKIKRHEIVSRWSPGTNLKPLMFQSDDRWKKMNVLGQVVNIIRESPDPTAQGIFLTQHISIPASSGITLVIPRDSLGYEELVSTADLPLFFPKSE